MVFEDAGEEGGSGGSKSGSEVGGSVGVQVGEAVNDALEKIIEVVWTGKGRGSGGGWRVCCSGGGGSAEGRGDVRGCGGFRGGSISGKRGRLGVGLFPGGVGVEDLSLLTSFGAGGGLNTFGGVEADGDGGDVLVKELLERRGGRALPSRVGGVGRGDFGEGGPQVGEGRSEIIDDCVGGERVWKMRKGCQGGRGRDTFAFAFALTGVAGGEWDVGGCDGRQGGSRWESPGYRESAGCHAQCSERHCRGESEGGQCGGRDHG